MTKNLPCSAPSRTPRPSRAGRWRAIVLVGVHLAFALHLAHLYGTGSSVSPLEPSEAMEFSKHSVVNAGLIFFALLLLSTLLLGRFFCGWGCHLVALQDLCRWMMLKVGITPKPLRSRLLAFVPLLAAVYMFFLPWLGRLWLGIETEEMRFELSRSAESYWDTFPGLGVSIATFLVCGFAAVYVLGAKGFCTYGCPYGALFGAVDRLAPGRIRVTEDCKSCGHCTQVCSSNVAVSREVHEYGMVVDPGCMKCLDCISVCPEDALYVGFGRPALGAKPLGEGRHRKRSARLPWGEEIALALVFAGAFLAVRGLWVTDRERIPFLMALGLAGCIAGLALVGLRLLRKPKVSLQNLRLKEGRITGQGLVVSALVLLVLAGTAHAGYVRWLDARAESLEQELGSWKAGWFAPDRPSLDEDTRARMQELRARSLALRSAALVESPLNAGRLAWASLWLGQDAAASAFLMEGLQRHPGDAWLHYLAGQRARAAQRPQEALPALLEAARLRPDLPPVTGAAAETLFESGRPDEALGLLEGTLAHHPESVLLRANRAFLLAALGRTAEADRAFEETVALAPTDIVLRSRWAQLRFMTGRVDEALEVLREGARLVPDSADAHGTLADALLSAGALQEAQASIERALELEPGRADLLQVRAGVEAALSGR